MLSSRNNPALGGGDYALGMVTWNLGKDWELPSLIEACEETGFRSVELRTTHRHGVEPNLGREERVAVASRFGFSPIRLLSLGTACEFHSTDRSVVSRNIEVTRQFVELAHDVGALGVKVRPNGIPDEVPESQTLNQIAEALRECGRHAQGYGVEIWLEVHGPKSNSPARVRRIMELADHPMVGVCWNSNPEDVEEGSVAGSFELLKPWLRNVHIRELWRKDYPWRELFDLLTQAGYRRYTLAEIPASSDAVRLMRYYEALWSELKG